MNLYSYIVRHDSGFAPNPFHGCCTLATCKPRIRKDAGIEDWVIGCGSADKKRGQGGKLVYAMKVNETLTFLEYFKDKRFSCKKPNLRGSRKQTRGDNIYSKIDNVTWQQLNSVHSNKDGSPNTKHIARDTRIDKVLISNHYVYFGKHGPTIPNCLNSGGISLCHAGQGHRKFSTRHDNAMIEKFKKWFYSFEKFGFVEEPYDWHQEDDRRR